MLILCKIKKYLILDCETATLPIENYVDVEIDSETKRKIATKKPLIYDLAWLICDRSGYVYKRVNLIIAEIFFNEQLFNTAYYKDKKPIYLQAIANNKFQIVTFDKALEMLIADMQTVTYSCAYNAMFDFKRAIPFTQRYLHNRDSKFYYNIQKESIYNTIENKKSNYKNPDFTKAVLEINGFEFPIIDIWYEACEKLLNCDKYKNWCIQNKAIGKRYFKTDAENATRYLLNNLEFNESHTALKDCEIEKDILVKCINRKAVQYQEKIKPFPFQKLGTVKKFVEG